MINKPIRTGIIGYGLSGRIFHAPFIHAHPEFRLIKVVERNGLNAVRDYPYVETVRDYKELTQDSEIELVILCVPNSHHFQMAKECLEAGKHIVVEKPFMNTSAEADAIIKLAESKGLYVFVYQNRRWDGDFLTIKKINENGLLGDIMHFEAHFDRYSPERKRAAWRDELIPGSGNLFDLGSHLIDQVLTLFGKPDSLSADLQSQRKDSKVDDYFEVILNYPGLTAIVTAGMLVLENDLRYMIHGSSGSFVKYGIDPQEALLKAGKKPETPDWGKEDSSKWGNIAFQQNGLHFDGRIETNTGDYMRFYQNVYDVIRNGADYAIKPDEARNVIRIIELAFESHQLKKEIQVHY